MPIIGEAHSNRLIWTASKYFIDLYLGDVMSTVVGNKLLECNLQTNKNQIVVSQLHDKVMFPDIRKLVNNGELDITTVMNIRKHGKKFRQWLQQEAEKDRDTVIAYHEETIKASGITKVTASTLKMFGNLLQFGPQFYTAVNPNLIAPIVAAGAGIGGGFLTKIGNALDKEWRPVFFGNWVINEISKKNNKN
jgi:hypothetical protein